MDKLYQKVDFDLRRLLPADPTTYLLNYFIHHELQESFGILFRITGAYSYKQSRILDNDRSKFTQLTINITSILDGLCSFSGLLFKAVICERVDDGNEVYILILYNGEFSKQENYDFLLKITF